MATILERFRGTAATATRRSGSANDSSSFMASQPIIKHETSKKSSCPFTDDAKQDNALASANGSEGQSCKTSPTRNLSPEFLLGSVEESEEPAKTERGTSGGISCVFCNEVVADKAAVKEHIRTKHDTFDKKWYDCPICDKRFTHRSSRETHLRVHTGSRPYECEYCKKRFRVSSHLRDHVRTHTGERPFKCGICGRGFKQSSDMKKHRKTHFKAMPAVPPDNAPSNTSYTVVRPEDNTTSSDHKPNALLPPAPERQKLKLVIKLERNATDTSTEKSAQTATANSTVPPDNCADGAHTVPGDNTLPSRDCIHGEETVSGCNNTSSCESSYQDSMEANNTTVLMGNVNHNGNVNFDGRRYFSHEDASTSKSADSLSKSNPVKNALKRKLEKSAYPSMASRLGGMYTSVDESVGFHREPSALELSTRLDADVNNKHQEATLTNQHDYASDTDKIRRSQVAYEKRFSLFADGYSQVSPENGEHDEFRQPSNKIIKTERLSPNPYDQHESLTAQLNHLTAHHGFTARYEPLVSKHEVLTSVDLASRSQHEPLTDHREQSANIHEQITNIYEQSTDIHNRITNPYEKKRNAGDQRSVIQKQNTFNEETASYDKHITNGLHERNRETSAATTEKSSNPEINVTERDTKEGADSENYTESQTLGKDVEANQQIVTANVTSEPKAINRKPIVVKLRREKALPVKTSRKAIKLKENDDVKCSVCEQTYKHMNEYLAHKCIQNGKSFKCTVCSKVFARQTLLRQHMVLHQGSKRFRFKCNYCGRAFRHRSHLRDHERIHTGERPFKCSFCPKAFKQASDHRKHENLHTGTTSYRCEKCSLDFKRCDALKRHAMMHPKGEVTLLKCDKCRSLFATADGHTSHVCSNKPFRYRCQICPQRFSFPDALRRHCYEMHREQSTLSCLKCEFCKLEFATLETLDKHLSTHRLEKTHRCTTCGQRFAMLNQLVEHAKIHSALSMATASASGRNDDKTLEETAANDSIGPHEEITPRSEAFPNSQGKRPDGLLNKAVRHLYDFRPSKYQPIVLDDQSSTQLRSTNPIPIFGDVAVGNWARGNRYLPIRPKDRDVLRKPGNTESGSPQQISPGDTTISPRVIMEAYGHDTMSSEGNKELPYIEGTDSSESKQISLMNATQGRRCIAESPENKTIPSRSSTEAFRMSAEPYGSTEVSRNHPTSFCNTDVEHRQPSFMSSENGSRASPGPTIVNQGSLTADQFSDRSFATYHAIATSRSMRRTPYGQRTNELVPNRKQQIPQKHVSVPDRHDTTSTRHDPMSDRDDSTVDLRDQITEDMASGIHYPTAWNRERFEVSVGPDVTGEPEEYCTEDNRAESSFANHVRTQSKPTQRSSAPAKMDFIEIPRNSGEAQNTPDKSSERLSFNSTETNPTRLRELFKQRRTPSNGSTSLEGQDLPLPEHLVKRKYTCLNCRLEFSQESGLLEHTCDIFAEILYSCLVCKKEFKEYEQLQNHMRRHWRQQVYFRCTYCGARLSSEELLKEHNLKHLHDTRTERYDSVDSDRDRYVYHRVAYDKTEDHPPESLTTPPGYAKSLTSPVISSISGNIVTKPTEPKRGYNEQVKDDVHTELSNINSRQPPDANSDSYLPYYEARKQAPDYLNVLSQGQAMVVSAMNTVDAIGRYHVPNGLLYPSTLSRSVYPTKLR